MEKSFLDLRYLMDRVEELENENQQLKIAISKLKGETNSLDNEAEEIENEH